MIVLREEKAGDLEAIRAIHTQAFNRPDEGRLVDALRDAGLTRLSLVALVSSAPAGHILFSEIVLKTAKDPVSALALAPVAVRPEFQRRRLGRALILAGLRRVRELGHRIVLVLGEPEYYGRFGFTVELARGVRSPWSGPHYMGLEFEPGALEGLEAEAIYPPPFLPYSTSR